ncbi:uncharacterized protein LOC134844838 [Symsagittifera roscoffensis]|uniref:uncharacterized protein LOC134844838 n=1 Tax=Symsagittifera roscoffensis TaxID=84072 RepID=UPI00307C3091
MAKKNGGQLRFCCDSHNLNVVTIKDAYPIPRIDETPSKLGDVKFFTTLDLGFASCSLMLIKTYERMGFTKEDLIRTSLILAAAICRAIYIARRSSVTVLHMGGPNLWMSFFVVRILTIRISSS